MEVTKDPITDITAEQFAKHFSALAKQFHSPDIIGQILQNMRIEEIPAGTRLIEYEGACSTLYLVWSGLLLASIEEQGVKITLGEVGPGEWIGEVTLIEPGPASASITCIEDSTLLSMSHEGFQKLRENYPAAAGALMHTLSLNLADRLRTYGNRAAEEIYDREYLMKDLPPEKRTSIITILARLMGIRGGKS